MSSKKTPDLNKRFGEGEDSFTMGEFLQWNEDAARSPTRHVVLRGVGSRKSVGPLQPTGRGVPAGAGVTFHGPIIDLKRSRINELVAAEQAKPNSSGAGDSLAYVFGALGVLAAGAGVAYAMKSKKAPPPGFVPGALISAQQAPAPAMAAPGAVAPPVPPAPAPAVPRPAAVAPHPAYAAPAPRPYVAPAPSSPSAPAPMPTQNLTSTPQGPAGIAVVAKQDRPIQQMAPGTVVAPGVTVGTGSSGNTADPNVYVVSQTDTPDASAPGTYTPAPGVVDSITNSLAEGFSALLGGSSGGGEGG